MRRVALLLSVLCAGCGPVERCENMHFDQFTSADRVIVRVASTPVGAPIEDAAKIEALVEFVVRHSDGWYVPAILEPPIPRVVAEFHGGNKFIGDFGVGKTFASAQGCNYFQTRKLPNREAREFARLLGRDEAEIQWK